MRHINWHSTMYLMPLSHGLKTILVCVYVHMQVCMFIRSYTSVHECVCVCSHTGVHECVCVHVCMCVCVCVSLTHGGAGISRRAPKRPPTSPTLRRDDSGTKKLTSCGPACWGVSYSDTGRVDNNVREIDLTCTHTCMYMYICKQLPSNQSFD